MGMFLEKKSIPKTNEKKSIKGLKPTPKVPIRKVENALNRNNRLNSKANIDPIEALPDRK